MAVEFEVGQSVLVGQIHLDVTELVILNSRIAHSELHLSLGKAAGDETNLSTCVKTQESGHIFVLG